MSESATQRDIVRTLRIALPHGWIVQSTANKPRSMVQGAIEKAMGTIAGWPDLAVYGCLITDDHEPRPFVGFLEVKTIKGRVSPLQRECHDRLREAGFNVAVVRSIDDALAAARAWGLPLRIAA